MNKKLTRTIAGVMSLMFVGQIMVFGDGACTQIPLLLRQRQLRAQRIKTNLPKISKKRQRDLAR